MTRYLLLLLCASAFAQQFDVATVKIAQPGSNLSMIAGINKDGQFTARNSPLRELLIYAYGTSQVSGPDWLKDARYDIVGSAPANAKPADAPAMVRALLEERLKVVAHRESRERDVYALEVTRGGVKIEANVPLKRPSFPEGAAMLGLNGTMTRWADTLGRVVDRPVVDRTGLEGTYAHMLFYGENENSPHPGVFTSLSEQTGLRLTATKANVEVVIIDRAERTPADN